MSAIESMNVSDRSRQSLEFRQNKTVPNYVIQIPDVTLLHIIYDQFDQLKSALDSGVSLGIRVS